MTYSFVYLYHIDQETSIPLRRARLSYSPLFLEAHSRASEYSFISERRVTSWPASPMRIPRTIHNGSFTNWGQLMPELSTPHLTQAPVVFAGVSKTETQIRPSPGHHPTGNGWESRSTYRSDRLHSSSQTHGLAIQILSASNGCLDSLILLIGHLDRLLHKTVSVRRQCFAQTGHLAVNVCCSTSRHELSRVAPRGARRRHSLLLRCRSTTLGLLAS